MRSATILPLALALAALCGCAGAPKKPADTAVSAEAYKVETKDQTLTDYVAVATIKIENQSDFPITATDAEWELVMDEKVVAKGEGKVGKEVPAKGSAEIAVSGRASYAKDGAEVEALSGKKSLDFALRGDLALTRPGGGETFVDWAKAGAVRTPRMPVARMYTVQATRSETQVDLVFLLEVSNPNPFDVKVGALKLAVALNDKPVGDHDTPGGVVPAGGAAQYSVPMTVTTADYGKDLIAHAKQNRVKYKMTGSMDLGLLVTPITLTGGVPFSQ